MLPYVRATVAAMALDAPVPPTIRGWCPSAYAPMESGDGWIVRARVGCRQVLADQWAVLAELADTLGNGLVELTMRGNVQVRGVAQRHTRQAARLLVDHGLAGVDEATDRRRIMVLDPLLEHGADRDAALEVVAGVEDVFEDLGGGLPPKWWALVDGGGAWPVPHRGSDVAVVRAAGSWRVVHAGGASEVTSDPVSVVRSIAERCIRGRRRVRDLTLDELDGLEPTVSPTAGDGRSPWSGIREFEALVVAGVAPRFGVATSAAIGVVHRIATTGEVAVHPTPQRGLVLVATPDARRVVERAVDELHGCGWITDAEDPRRLTSACIGSQGCSASMIDTWRFADELGATEPTHVSGCIKRCGAPAGVRELVATDAGIVEWHA